MEGKKTTYVVKPSLLYKRNDSVMKTLVLCVKEKLPHHNNLSVYNPSLCDVSVTYKTELSHSFLTRLRIDVCIYICISDRDDVFV